MPTIDPTTFKDPKMIKNAPNLHAVIDSYAPILASKVIGPPAAFFKPPINPPTMKPLEIGSDQVPEENVINRALETLKAQVKNFSPSLADLIEVQKPLVYAVAMAFKASLIPANKTYAMNPTSNALGVLPLFPAAIKPNTSTPSAYLLNSWDVPLTANTPAYLLGAASGSNEFYKGSDALNATTWLYIFANGLVEIGSTPSIEQIKIVSQEKQAISPYTVGPFIDVPVNKDYPAYIYPLPAFYIDNKSKGIKLAVLPRRTGTATLKLIGLVFYEYDFFSDFKTAT